MEVVHMSTSKLCVRAAAAKNDEAAFSDLYTMLMSKFEEMATKVAFRNAGVDRHELLSAYSMALWDTVKRFDPERGVFEHMLNNAIRKASAYVVRKKLADRNFASELCDPTVMEAEDAEHDMDGFMDSEYGRQLTAPSTEEVIESDKALEDIRQTLTDAGMEENDVQAAVLLASGNYTELEIARMVGHTGSDKAAGMWMVRLKGRVAKAYMSMRESA